MKFHHEFTVPLSLAASWDALSHVERLSPYLPGVRLQQAPDGTITGETDLHVGPIRLQYQGFGEFVEKDPQTHKALVAAHAVDGQGRRTAQATIAVQMVAVTEQHTRLVVDSDLKLTSAGFQAGLKHMAASGERPGWNVATPPGGFAAGGMRLQRTDTAPNQTEHHRTGRVIAAGRTGGRWAAEKLKDPRVAGAAGIAAGLAAARLRRRAGS